MPPELGNDVKIHEFKGQFELVPKMEVGVKHMNYHYHTYAYADTCSHLKI